jgi:hypothetical protein
MMVVDALCNGLLLPAMGALGLMFAISTTSAEEEPAEASQSPQTNAELERLRAEHEVTLIGENDEGTSFEQLPVGVYGFSYAPQQESPLFGKKMYQNFEVHKPSDGRMRVIGYVKEADFQTIEAGRAGTVHLYPDPYEQATRLVSVAMSRVVRAKGPTRDHGNALPLDLDESGASVH